MTDVERLKMLDLQDQLKFARNQVKDLQKEVKRLTMLLNGEDVIKNSLSSSPFDRLKSSYKRKKQ